MTDLTWPDRLPAPTYQGYGVEPQDAALRTEMEQGQARQRQQYTTVPERITLRWRFTDWEYGIFRSWYRNKAARGAAYFTIPLLSGQGIVPHRARFLAQASPFKATPSRGGAGAARWIVTATVEVSDSPDLSEDALDLVLTEDADGLIAATEGLHYLVNTTLPGTGGWA